MKTKVNTGTYYSNNKPEVQQVDVRQATDYRQKKYNRNLLNQNLPISRGETLREIKKDKEVVYNVTKMYAQVQWGCILRKVW